MIIDNMSRYIEELGVNTRNNGPISSETSSQMHGVFAMSILLAELLVLQVVDSIPSQAELNLESQRELMAHRIDVLCAQMLQSRVSICSTIIQIYLELSMIINFFNKMI